MLSAVAFRDDRDALRAKNEALSSELEEQADELERARDELARHEAKDESEEAELARLRRENARLKRKAGEEVADEPRSSGSMRLMAAALVLIAMVTGLSNALLEHRKRSQEAAAERAAVVSAEARAAEEARREAVRRSQREEIAAITPSERFLLGVVEGAAGEKPTWLTPGIGCGVFLDEVEAPLGVQCGRVLFSRDEHTSIVREGNRVELVREHPQSWSARFFVERAPTFSTQRITRVPLRQHSVTGEPPAPLEGCEVAIGSGFEHDRCHSTLRCGERVLYEGWDPCRFHDGRALFVEDGQHEDGDPAFLWRANRLLITSAEWSATFRVDSLGPRQYAGAQHRDSAEQLMLRFTPTEVMPRVDDESLQVLTSWGEIEIERANEWRMRGHFGPGFATIGGFDEQGNSFLLTSGPW